METSEAGGPCGGGGCCGAGGCGGVASRRSGTAGCRIGRPSNQSRAGPVQSMTVAAAIRAPSRPPVSGAVSRLAIRIGTATTVSPIRAPRCRCSTNTPSTAAAAALTPVTISAARRPDRASATLSPSPSPVGVESHWVTRSRVSTEFRVASVL